MLDLSPSSLLLLAFSSEGTLLFMAHTQQSPAPRPGQPSNIEPTAHAAVARQLLVRQLVTDGICKTGPHLQLRELVNLAQARVQQRKSNQGTPVALCCSGAFGRMLKPRKIYEGETWVRPAFPNRPSD